jgi:hypothetical protein
MHVALNTINGVVSQVMLVATLVLQLRVLRLTIITTLTLSLCMNWMVSVLFPIHLVIICTQSVRFYTWSQHVVRVGLLD